MADKNVPPNDLEKAKKNPVIKMWYEFDPSAVGKVDIHLEDNQIYKLGSLKIKTYLSPGHTGASICFYVKNVLFSGDVLFKNKVGRTDFLGGSGENIIKSVRRLYAQLPDETKVCPGYGEFTIIGAEKKENDEVTLNNAALEN
jgi:glyoxylase-like metal-dependent hydrolase (beta-lactamase superfamily II)